MKKTLKRTLGAILSVVMTLCIFSFNNQNVYAASSITGNNSQATAYNYGSWSRINSNYATIILEAGQDESWVKFTLSPNEHIYVRSSYDNAYAGEWFEIQDGAGNTLGNPQYTPNDVYNIGTVTPDIYLDCDNNSTSTRTYYLVLHRGSVDTTTSIYYSLSAYTRIRTSSTTVSISGTASNPGNAGMSASGVDSSVITVNLTSNTSIPNNAIVTSISTSGTQSPSQGNVHHMIMPNSSGVWYTSTVSSASSGSYNISISDNIPVKQLWSFKYNARATARSTMRSVKLNINFQYDLHDTNYELVVR